MRVKEQIAVPVTQNLAGAAALQTLGAAGPLTLTATPVSLDHGNGNPNDVNTPYGEFTNFSQPGSTNKWDGPSSGGSRVIITSAGNDSGITFTIVGTDFANNAQSEVLTGGAGVAVTSALDYKTVSSITASGATASTVEAGWGTEYITPWIQCGNQRGHTQWYYDITVGPGATANYNLEATDSPLNRPDKCYTGKYTDNVITLSNAQTTSQNGVWVAPYAYVRVRVNSLTGGSLVFRVIPSRTV